MKEIGEMLFRELTGKASESPRKRAHFNLHKTLDEGIHRLCIAAEPGTYIRPHRHTRAGAWELLVILKGAIELFVFDDDGRLAVRTRLSGRDSVKAMEIDAGAFHCFVSREPGTVALEVKSGPYIPTPEEDFAAWAPPEGAETAARFLDGLNRLAPGDVVK